MDTKTLTALIKQEARSLGFELVGVTSPQPPAHLDVYQGWLAAGRHGEMGYLATERSRQRRADPQTILPDCRSILVLGIPYNQPLAPATADNPPHGRVAAYAWGDDYHAVLKPRIKALVDFIETQVGQTVTNRWYTDTGPILERELAQRAGLGWIGKNTMLINPRRGSYFLLAEILLGIELEFDAPVSVDHCGTCMRCIEACPTNCILPDRTLDASRCISYLTIELKGPIPVDLRPQLGEWVFGCDICQQVCPWNEQFAAEEGDAAFAPRPDVRAVDLQTDLALSSEQFNRKFKGSPLKRTKRRGYLRNLAVALGNARQPASAPALAQALQDDEAHVRGHAAWALGQVRGPGARQALVMALEWEQDAGVREEIAAALASLED